MKLHESNLAYVPIMTPEGVEGGRLYYSPLGAGILERGFETHERMKIAFVEPLRGCKLLSDGRGADKESETIVDQAERQLSEMVNYICGVETASEAFQKYRPFETMSNDAFWAEAVMDALYRVVASVMENPRKSKHRIKKWR